MKYEKIVLSKTTAAESSDPFALSTDQTSLNVICCGLQGTESAVLQMKDPVNNGIWVNVQINSVVPTFNSSNNWIQIQNDWGVYRVSKSVTASPVGVSISSGSPA